MSKIVNLKIKNFRGIKELEQIFDNDFICLVGRGDTGKSTILEAISYVLSPSWNVSFYDTDFYNCDINNNIEVETTIIDIPSDLTKETKYGLYIRSYNKETKTISDAFSNNDDEKALTIKLVVDKTLEPKWSVITLRAQEEKLISSNDRSKINCFLVSDYVDRHFSWNKGNPLYSLSVNKNFDQPENNTILDTIRVAKQSIDKDNFEELKTITENIQNQAASLGLNIPNARTTIDFKDLAIKDGKICLHDDNVPFRLKGKGSKRLLSIAIQLSLAKTGGIVLIDEVEQGLEPDRIKQIVRTLKNENNGQIFITTHSRDAITELNSEDLCITKNNEGTLSLNSTDMDNVKIKGVIRACPEAFFATKVIICEGATEIGICRALDQYRESQRNCFMVIKDCYYIDGSGDNLFTRAEEIKEFKDVCVLMDSDKVELKDKKEELKNRGINIFDYDENNSIEKQVFNDLSWNAISELIEYVKKTHNKTDESILQSLRNKDCTITKIEDNAIVREKLAQISVVENKEWFKRIDHGEFLGNVIFKYFGEMKDKKLKETLIALSNWIDS